MASVKVLGVLQGVVGRNGILRQTRNIHKKVGVIGVPFDKGQHREGVGLGPDELRRQGLIEKMREIGCEVIDYGNITYKPKKDLEPVKNMSHLEHLAACQELVSQKVQEIISRGEVAMTLGGDHSVSVGSVDGHQRAKGDVALLWVDAHADLNTNSTSPTGNVHGMPVALLAKELADYWPYLPGMDWQMPRRVGGKKEARWMCRRLSIRNIAFIGLRDLDVYERLVIDKWGVAAFGMEDVQRVGAIESLRLALSRIDPRRRRSLHLSFDIDSLDPIEAPSTGYAVRGGLTLREGLSIMEEAVRTGRLAAVDIVEFNPSIGDARDCKRTAEAAIALCRAASGHSRAGTLPPHDDLPLPPPPKDKVPADALKEPADQFPGALAARDAM